MSENISSTQSNQVVIQCNGKSSAISSLLLSLLWNVAVIFFIFLTWSDSPQSFSEKPVFYVLILFLIIGIWYFYHCIMYAINWFRFGAAPLTLNTYPVYIWGNASGYIDFNTPFVPDMKAEISLRCVHHFTVSRSNISIGGGEDSSGSNTSSLEEIVRWREDLLVPCESHGDKTRVLFSFLIDENLPHSQGKIGDKEYYEWVVVLKLPKLGNNMERRYVVSVDKYYPPSADK